MIKEMRNKKNYTQEEMADKLGISLRHYVRIDNEKIIPRPDVFANLIKVFGMKEKEIGKFIIEVLENKKYL